MGIVNVNDDSFSGDGTLDVEAAIGQARRHVAAGADIIDVGAESARTNRPPIPEEEEIRRFEAFLERWDEVRGEEEPRDGLCCHPPLLSVNTWRPAVVEAVLAGGRVDLLNDMGGLPDDRNARLCAASGAALLIMHSTAAPKIPQRDRLWPDVMAAMEGFFREKIALALAAGMAEEALLLDPGIDFAKQREDNLRVYRDLERLTALGRPLLVPVSRKSVIGRVLDLEDPRERDAGTIACIAAAMARGAAIFRVHNTAAAWQAVKVLDALDVPESAGNA